MLPVCSTSSGSSFPFVLLVLEEVLGLLWVWLSPLAPPPPLTLLWYLRNFSLLASPSGSYSVLGVATGPRSLGGYDSLVVVCMGMGSGFCTSVLGSEGGSTVDCGVGVAQATLVFWLSV